MSMSTVTFDKLAYTQALRSGGFTAEQAETSAHALDTALRDSVATKSDIATLRSEVQAVKVDLEHRIDAVEARLDSKIDRVAVDLKREMVAQKNDLLKWLVPLFLGQAAAIVALGKLL